MPFVTFASPGLELVNVVGNYEQEVWAFEYSMPLTPSIVQEDGRGHCSDYLLIDIRTYINALNSFP